MRTLPEYRTVKQPQGSRICGACVVAMVLGESLDRVVTEARGGDECCSRLTWMAEYLARRQVFMGAYAIAHDAENGGRMSVSNFSHLAMEMPIVGSPCILGVDSETSKGLLHWVFWDGTVVRDSAFGVPGERPLSDYDGRVVDVYPVVYIEDEYTFEEWAIKQEARS